MTTTPTSPRRATLGVGVLFFVNGATFSNWLPRIPEIRDSLGLSNDSLGVTLLGGGLGGIIGSLIVGRISDRMGSRHLVVLAATLLSIGMPLVAFVPNAPLLLAVLSALGILDVLNDVAMNTQGVIAQGRMSRPIMNRLHAAWSLGFTSGALVGGAAAAARIGIRWHLTAVGAVLLVTVYTVRHLLDPVDPPPTPHTEHHDAAVPRRRVSGLAVLVALAAIGAIGLEVLPNDWAAVLMRDEFDAGRFAGLGTVACAGAMLVGRLAGDHVLMRVGEHRLLVGAQVLVGTGAVITVATPFTAVAVTGLVVWGLGLSVFFPSLYAMAARLPGTSAGAGLGSMLFGQRSGALLVAVCTGAVGEWQGMRAAFAVVAGASFVLLAVGMNRLRAVVATPARLTSPSRSPGRHEGASMSTGTGIEVERIAGACGAVVRGFDLRDAQSPDQVEALRRIVDEHLVVALPDQHLGLDQLERFTDELGGRDVTPYVTPVAGRPYVIRVIKEPTDELNFANAWHTDLSYLPAPPAYTVLHAWDVPAYGGDTMWANQYLAYETLPAELQERLLHLRATHSAGMAYGTGGYLEQVAGRTSMAIEPSPEAHQVHNHPAVIRHPRTGRAALFVNPVYTTGFEGLPADESRALLHRLTQHAVHPNLTCRIRWQQHQLVIWDNFATQHFAINDYAGQRREMYRTSVRGTQPVAA